ncbi:uncharacterized protein PG998_010865 [Apiospora kogelbergensis]|uniref:Uncharacterized protein n=1 Tax=Apiospora kogelbergensis TaxID=1337665 RepID=A0AAW0RDS5_9PEZI
MTVIKDAEPEPRSRRGKTLLRRKSLDSLSLDLGRDEEIRWDGELEYTVPYSTRTNWMIDVALKLTL